MNKKATRQKVEAVEHWVPQSHDDVVQAIAEIGRHQRERELIKTAMNDQLAAFKEQFEAQAKPHADRIAELTRGVHLWCETNRAALTKDGKVKFHHFATGEVKWRLRPPSIAVRGAEKVVAFLKGAGLTRFLRTKEEIDKDALLKDLDTARSVVGITVSQKEDFVVQPFETQLEEVQS